MATNHEAIAEKLAERARELGSDSNSLDEMVCASAISDDELNAGDESAAEAALAEMEAGASEINNEGFDGQILYLLECGVPQGEIEAALGLAA